MPWILRCVSLFRVITLLGAKVFFVNRGSEVGKGIGLETIVLTMERLFWRMV